MRRLRHGLGVFSALTYYTDFEENAVSLDVGTQGLGYIKRNSGQTMESIARALNMTTKELVLPARKLLLEKKIVAKGQKRATRYFPR